MTFDGSPGEYAASGQRTQVGHEVGAFMRALCAPARGGGGGQEWFPDCRTARQPDSTDYGTHPADVAHVSGKRAQIYSCTGRPPDQVNAV